MRVLIGMETSGRLRLGFRAAGHDARSVDLLPAEGDPSGHTVGDVFAALESFRAAGWWPDLAIFHPDCTYLTRAAEWAYADPNRTRYPNGGYHQRLRPGTLFGAERRAARERAIAHVLALAALPIPRIAIENPVGILSSRWRRPDQIVQPYEFGDDASKATCLWLRGLPPLERDPAQLVPGRLVAGNRRRWGNQTDSGQDRAPQVAGRWAARARTFPGVARAIVAQWGEAKRAEAGD